MTSEDPAELTGVYSEGQAYFDAEWYCTTYSDVTGVDPWGHFVQFGDRERRSPGPEFDAAFYAKTYLPLEAGAPLRHFLTEGRDAGHLPARRQMSVEESHEAMVDALAGLHNPMILVGNDAQQAGAPLLLLEIARHLRRRDYSPVFLLLRGGPLLAAYGAVGPVLMLDEGYDLSGMSLALEPSTPALGNTALSAPVLSALGPGRPSAILVHEMPDFLRSEGLVEEVGRTPVVVAAFPNIASELTEVLPRTARVVTIRPGLLHVSVGPQSTARVRDLIRATLGSSGPLFLGAGYADPRKGFDRFIAMAEAIYAREPDSRFIWLGELSDWAQGIATRATHAGLPMMLPGFRRDAAAWYDNADVYLLSSRQDPGPTTVVDAARRGTPFVAAPGDLGLRSLGDVLADVGRFCESEDEAVAEAVALARRDTSAERDRRAAVIEQYASFPRYIDELLGALPAAG